ncbi:MAG: AMP-binding protein [Spirochaetes bacterium]|nr:AMP-binding protein [Spirochaetota bacterium]
MKETIVEMFEKSIASNWDRNAVSDFGGRTYTYGEVGKIALMLHHQFKETGVRHGDKIALIGKNSAAWAITYISIISYGAVVVPVLADFHVDDMHHIVNHSESKLLFVSDDIFEKLDPSAMKKINAAFSLNTFQSLYHSHKHIAAIIHEAKEHFVSKKEPHITAQSFAFPKSDNKNLAAILYTSGTTGFSKGVMLPLLSLSSNVVFAHHNFDLTPDDAIVAFLPVAHVFGCAFDFLFPFTAGCHIHFISRIPSPKIILEAFAAIRPRLICTVPLVIEKIYLKQIKPLFDKGHIQLLTKVPFVNKALGSIVYNKLDKAFGGRYFELIIGGAALNQEVETFLKNINFRYTVGYGMTECGPIISYSDWRHYCPGSVGKAVERMEIKIDSPDPQNVTGEIMVRGDNITDGYYKDKDTTKDTIDKDGWLRTGDLGTIDKDGNVFIKGRCKTMLLGPSGQNIYPEEVEAKLNYLPYVQESLVVERDKKLVALVYPDIERADAEGLSEHDLEKKMQENLSLLAKKLPSYITVSRIELYPEEFEKTPKKSIKRFLYTRA